VSDDLSLLHPLAKQYLLRWLFVQAPLRLSIVNSWVMATTTSQQAHAHAMRTLWELHLLTKEDPHRAAAAAAAAASGVKPEPAADSKSTAADSDPLVWFHPSFQRSLQDALSNHVDSAEGSVSDSSAAATDPHRPSIEQLEAYASDRWDDILHWMVGATRPSATGGGIPPREVTSRLVSMGLMEDPSAPSSTAAAGGLGLLTADGGGGGGGRPRMSPSGFTFLLKDVATQAWDVVLGYIDTGTSNAAAAASASGAGALGNAQVARDQMLHFLFRLSFLKLGMGYPTASLTPIQRQLLLDLTAFGLVYMHSPSAAVYYPTRLALNLSSTSGGAPQGSAPSATAAASAAATAGASSAAAAATIAESRAVTASSAASSQGFLLLETTFRLYAFTSSSFHAALLSLFTRLDVRLPNLLVGTLTKESVRRALKAHINAADIIAYLEAYARADQRALTPVLPENVTDQLRLWEAERNRMAMQDAFLFEFDSNVDSPQVIRLVTEEAFRHPHTLLLHHPAKKIIVVTPEGYAILKAFKLRLNEQMAQAAAAASKQV
jgi:transcription initiation factor TFIIH subunit 4